MPARELRDQQLGDQETPPAPEIAPLGEGQLQLDARHQRLAVQIVLSDFRAAQDARNSRDFGMTAKGDKLDFDKWLKELVDLYYGHREAKTEPWKYCSNRSMMIGMTILEVLHSRMLPAVYNEELTHWRPGDRTDAAKVERVQKFMSWWVRVRAQLREFFDRWVKSAIAFGHVVTETQWTVDYLDTGKSSEPTPVLDEQGLPLTNPDGSPALVPGEKILTPFESTRSDIIPPEDVFLAPGATSLQKDPVILRMKYLFRDLEELEKNGQAANVTQSTAENVKPLSELLQVSLPDTSGLSPEEVEEIRRVALRNKEIICLKAYVNIDLDGDGFPEPVRVLIDQDHELYLGGVAIHELSVRGQRHLDLTQYLHRPDEPQGLWGLGALEQIKEMALEIDALFNQLTDANSLNILRPIFYDPNGDLDAGALRLAPMKATAVPNPSQNVYIPEFNIATERLINAIQLVLSFVERLTAASDYVLGRESSIVGGSGTATRTQAILGSANQRHSVPVSRLREGAARILTQHLDCIQKNIPDGFEERVLGETNEPIFQPGELSQEGLSGAFDAYLLPDEAFGSKEAERELAQLLYTTLMENVLVMSDPTRIYKVTSDLLKAFGKDPMLYIGPEPDYRMADSPDDEHTLLLEGNFGAVRASIVDNPIEHLMAHQAFLQDASFQALEPALQQQVGGALQQHMQEHMQMMQLQMASAQQAKAKGASSAGQPGSNGRAASAQPPVGPEPGVGSVQDPRAQAGAVQRRGESLAAAQG